MTDPDALCKAFRDMSPSDTATGGSSAQKRERRALRTRARALSPLRILLSLMLVPFVTVGLTVSIFVQTSEFERTDAVRHLIALVGGCEAALTVNAAPAAIGEPGYHARNDLDGDGIACDFGTEIAMAETVLDQAPALPQDPENPPIEQRIIGGAKFLRP